MDMRITNFKEAFEFYQNCKLFKQDVPDGMWDEVRETALDFIREAGKDTSKWSKNDKDAFTEVMTDIAQSW